MNRVYMCIDLKSFYASVECVERGLDPMTTNLVVADSERTEKTICLAVSPSLKQYGLSGRSRLFEVVQKIKDVNNKRKVENNFRKFIGKSYDDVELKNNKNLMVDYIIAIPRMSFYIKYSAEIYNIYLKYLSEDDIYVYSIDEVFCDITDYLNTYKMSPRELVTTIIHDVYENTGITATAGIGSNLYLAKVAMDIVAKHSKADKYGVRIAELDVMSYRKKLWDYKPLTSFWRVGKGISKKLEDNKMYTMGDVARCSLENEDLLYKLFGINAELLIDHAWGYEPCTLKIIKEYKPKINSLTSGQVLHCSCNYNQTKLIVKEMIDSLSLDLVDKGLGTNQVVITIGYDIECLTNPKYFKYCGEITTDFYGRKVPKPAHGTINLKSTTSSSKIIRDATIKLFDSIVNKNLLFKRINVIFNNVESISNINKKVIEQFDLFSDSEEKDKNNMKEILDIEEEMKIQRAMLEIKKKYGKNSILKAMDYVDGATARERNNQIGGHRG